MALTKAFGEPLRGFFTHLQDKPPQYVVCRAADIRADSHRRCRNVGSGSEDPSPNAYYSLVSEFRARSVFPCIIEVPANAGCSAPSEHHGEEFIFVLEGQLVLTTLAEDKKVEEVLRAGDSCFLDASVPHALRGETRNPYSETSATVLDIFWCPLGESYLFSPESS
jgi:mannose-6-phosphate isomerase-like protein (cupin superfamily)